MTSVYGDPGPSGILGNSAAQLWGATDDPDTLRRLSDLLGTKEISQQSVSADPHRGFFSPYTTSISTSTTRVAVMDASALRVMANPLLLVSGLPPTPCKLRYHDRDRGLRRLSGLRPPEVMVEAPEAEPAKDEEIEALLEEAPAPEQSAPAPAEPDVQLATDPWAEEWPTEEWPTDERTAS
jgi:type IV secretory pathway TraG/TraD family ATPase VirD4